LDRITNEMWAALADQSVSRSYTLIRKGDGKPFPVTIFSHSEFLLLQPPSKLGMK
jgi:hypothetical protein